MELSNTITNVISTNIASDSILSPTGKALLIEFPNAILSHLLNNVSLYIGIPLVILAMMFITLIIALSVKENGRVTIRQDSFFFMFRKFMHLPKAFFQSDWRYIFDDNKYWRNSIDSYCEKAAKQETSLCGLFWSNFTSFFIVFPIALVCIAFSICIITVFGPIVLSAVGIFKLIVLIGIFIWSLTKFTWNGTGNLINKTAEAFESIFPDPYSKYSPDKYESKVEEFLRQDYLDVLQGKDNRDWKDSKVQNSIFDNIFDVLSSKFKVKKVDNEAVKRKLQAKYEKLTIKIAKYKEKKARREQASKNRREAWKRKVEVIKAVYGNYLCPKIEYSRD